MKKIQLLPILLSVFFGVQHLYSQDSLSFFKPKPITAEEFVGDKRQFFQIVVNKLFVEKEKIGLLSLSSYAADYKDKLSNNEFQNTTLIYHPLYKGISINSGTSFTSLEGMKNFVGLQYIYQGKNFSLIYMPLYYFTKNQKISNLAFIEYKPKISKNWSLYTRLQLHYNYDVEKGNHFRSYVYSRLGLSYKYFSFGIGHNYDCYGADKDTKNNYGAFLTLTL